MAAKPVLGFLRVDMGGHGRWDRVLAKCREDARRHAAMPAVNQAIAADQFEIALVTSLPQKAERLCQALKQLSSLPAIPIRVTSIPELVPGRSIADCRRAMSTQDAPPAQDG